MRGKKIVTGILTETLQGDVLKIDILNSVAAFACGQEVIAERVEGLVEGRHFFSSFHYLGKILALDSLDRPYYPGNPELNSRDKYIM